jgi:hypothetical protein
VYNSGRFEKNNDEEILSLCSLIVSFYKYIVFANSMSKDVVLKEASGRIAMQTKY